MSLALAVMILLITAIIAALALFLIATIVQLVKINRGLAVVIGGVGEIVAKSAPVNGVVDAINGNLVAGRNLLENLFIKKAGDDAGGLVESLFPGEGAKFLQRVGRRGPVINTGVVYTRGVGILASLGRGAPIGAAHAKGPAVRDPHYSTTAASMLYPRPGGDPKARPKSPVVGSNFPRQYEAATTPGVRPRNRDGSEAPPPPEEESSSQEASSQQASSQEASSQEASSQQASSQQASSQQASSQEASSQQSSSPDMPTGRVETRQEEEQQASSPPPPSSGDGGGDAPADPGRLNVKGKRPWER